MLPASAPATPTRIRNRRSSSARAARAAAPRAGCGAYPSRSSDRATRESGARSGSYRTETVRLRMLARDSRTPGATRGRRSMSHTHAAQCMPSTSSSAERVPSPPSRVQVSRNFGSSNSSYAPPVVAGFSGGASIASRTP